MPLYAQNGVLLRGGLPGSLAGSTSCCCPECQGPCQWQPVWLSSGEWDGGWELVQGCVPATPDCACPEPTADNVGTEAYPTQQYWETACGPPITCGGFCGYSWSVEQQAWLGPVGECESPCVCLEVELDPPEDPMNPGQSIETPCVPP